MNNYNELQHHGIKGQKWGIRRYQNPDGSLTEAGLKRYAKDYDRQLRKLEKKSYGPLVDAKNSQILSAEYKKKAEKYNDKYENLSSYKKESSKGQRLLEKGKKYTEKSNDYSMKSIKSFNEYLDGQKEISKLLNKIDNDPNLFTYNSRVSVYGKKEHHVYADRIDYDRVRVTSNKNKADNKNKKYIKRGETFVKEYYYVV